MAFELSNDQRRYFGLEPIESHWERSTLKADPYRPESIVYFDGEIIKRHIVSTDNQYKENQYDELTRNRTILLPKTDKGKEKKLSASVLESRQPTGTYCIIYGYERVFIGNYNTQTTFYDTRWENPFLDLFTKIVSKDIKDTVDEFINSAPEEYLSDINHFKQAKRKHCKFKGGDYFAFKVSRTQYGFGRILVDIDQLKKKNILPPEHSMRRIMAKPVLVKIYAYLSESKNIDVGVLQKVRSLPSDTMMDNQLLYGQFEIIGNHRLRPDELDFPMSYGQSSNRQSSLLQWGLIQRELPLKKFNKYLATKLLDPYSYVGIKFYPEYSSLYEIENTIANNGNYDYTHNHKFHNQFDLRNPANKGIRDELMRTFGLDPAKSYDENCLLTNTATSQVLI